jgi:esterase FrsA
MDVTATRVTRYVKTIDEVREDLLGRARVPTHPWPPETDAAVVERIFAKVHSLDRDAWAEAFYAEARPFDLKAAELEAAGDRAGAQANYRLAYCYYRMARYPAPNSAGKLAAYKLSVEAYIKATRYFDPPLERVVMPFDNRPGENDSIIGHSADRPLGWDR